MAYPVIVGQTEEQLRAALGVTEAVEIDSVTLLSGYRSKRSKTGAESADLFRKDGGEWALLLRRESCSGARSLVNWIQRVSRLVRGVEVFKSTELLCDKSWKLD